MPSLSAPALFAPFAMFATFGTFGKLAIIPDRLHSLPGPPSPLRREAETLSLRQGRVPGALWRGGGWDEGVLGKVAKFAIFNTFIPTPQWELRQVLRDNASA